MIGGPIPIGRRVTVEVPASSANLGPGYDVLALALELRLRVTVEVVAGDTSLAVEGEGAGSLRLDEGNRFLAGLRAGAREGGRNEVVGLRIEMVNDIPLRRGLGSSAAATMAGLLVARELLGAALSDGRLLALGAEIEGHPENAAAALLGGFVVCGPGPVVHIDPPDKLRAALFIPEREMATVEMRAVLPTSVAHADAVRNAAAVAQLVSAFAGGDVGLLAAMYEDRLHEPYRAEVYPELRALVVAARSAGALGAALSGAGSAVIALCPEESSAKVAAAFESEAAAAGLAGHGRVVGLASAGARVVG